MPRPALSAERATEVVELLTLHPIERFTLTEIAQRCDINPSSAHALLMTLIRAGFVRRHATHKTYTLGPALIAAGTAALEQLPGIKAAQAEMDALGQDLGLEAFITTLADEQVIVVWSGRHVSPYGTGLILGQKLPLMPPIGLLFVAFWLPREIDRWLRRAEPRFSKGETDRLLRVMEVVRRTGYVVALESDARRGIGVVLERRMANDPTNTEKAIESLAANLSLGYRESTFEAGQAYDISAITAAIFDPNALPTAALALGGFAQPLSTAAVLEISERLAGLARMITKQTHGRLPPELD